MSDINLRKYLGIIVGKPAWWGVESSVDLKLNRGSKGLLNEMYSRIVILENTIERLKEKLK